MMKTELRGEQVIPAVDNLLSLLETDGGAHPGVLRITPGRFEVPEICLVSCMQDKHPGPKFYFFQLTKCSKPFLYCLYYEI